MGPSDSFFRAQLWAIQLLSCNMNVEHAPQGTHTPLFWCHPVRQRMWEAGTFALLVSVVCVSNRLPEY